MKRKSLLLASSWLVLGAVAAINGVSWSKHGPSTPKALVESIKSMFSNPDSATTLGKPPISDLGTEVSAEIDKTWNAVNFTIE